MKRSINLFLSAFCFLVLSGNLLSPAFGTAEAPKEDTKISLRLKLEKGKTYKFNMITEQKINQKVMNNKMELEQTIGMGIDFKVTDVDEKGIHAITMVYTSVLFKQSGSPMGTIEYDSKKSPENIPASAKGFAALVGLSLGMKMDNLGQVKDVTGSKEFFEKMIEKLQLPDGPQKELVSESLKNQFGEKSIKKMMGQMSCVFPEKELGIGDSWKQNISMTGPMPLNMNNTYTLKEIKKDLVVLNVESDLKPNKDPKAATQKIGNMEQKIELSGTQKGTLEINPVTGWTRKSKLTQNLTGKITMTSPYSMTIPMDIKSITTITGK